ncbi:MAG: TRCF domain-containing protein, partial [Pseudomonadota bacterium]
LQNFQALLQSLDTLGAGFTLASHDLDIRGAGNLLGEEQSGHIKEVGFELYQSMLEDAINALKDGGAADTEEQWSPQISLGTPVLLPEAYVPDLQLRLSLYRRISGLETRDQIDDMASELVDRFGELPDEVRHLLEITEIKAFCRHANIAQIDAGPKGASITFRKNTFPNPAGLAKLAGDLPDSVSIGADHKLIYRAGWENDERRVAGARSLTKKLAQIAQADG